jgi:hypothetical protein
VAASNAGILAKTVHAQFARTPYAVSFARASTQFTLVTLHIV